MFLNLRVDFTMNLVRPIAVLSLMLSVSACNTEELISSNASFRCEIPSEVQQAMLSRVNFYREQTVNCGGQIFNGAPALTWNSQLEAAAQVHANDMAKYDFFSHVGSDGSDGALRIEDQNYNWVAWGENLASGAESTKQAVDRLINSPEHCVNIMESGFAELGGACAQNADSYFGTYYVQVFGDR
ncbi:MAG: SCP/PR1 domain-containing proteins [uncultured Thiotrichaceae bacterium]|uniref:SCP/PR1 domain-containing proteins n=1 Tax=uncultured Thiotrichaceae bacterium TaxID=298394 RepID=A0A6S6TV54_9GAMM|nr:MAG: SCP/PR1 domain-containing proteins [uncultured Thiotrichaceae bacterium]